MSGELEEVEWDATENAKKEHYEEKALESVKTCYWTDAKTVTATSQCAHDAYESAGGDAADAAELRDEMRELLRRSDDEGARFGALPKTTVTASGASFACDDASDFIVDEVEMFGRIPSRNAVLGRRPTEEERLYLKPVKKGRRYSSMKQSDRSG